jgi:peptide/nickel transport system substrate-binding protein
MALVMLFGLVGSLLLGTAAFAQETGTTPASAEPVVFDVGVDSDITSLNPFNLCCGPDYEVMSLIYDTAWQYDTDTLKAAPGFIESWEHSEDYMDWTLHTVSGASFSDGEPATAEDLAFSFALIADYQMPFFKDYFPFKPTFEVVDDTTVIWHSTEPTFAPEVPAYAPVLPQHIWEPLLPAGDPSDPEVAKEARKAVKEFENEEAIGSGAFTLEEYSDGQFIHLVKSDSFWGTEPASITEVIFHVYGNQEAMVQSLKSGELDFAEGLNPTLFNSLEGEPNIGTHVGDGGCWGNIAWNFGGQKEAGGSTEDTADPVIHELAFRQAVARSIDRQEIVDKVYQGTSVVAYSILMPGTNGSWVADIPEELQFNYDPEAAKAQLDDAGIVDNDGDGIREYEGENINLELLTITDVAGSVDTGKFIQGYLKDIGIDSFFTTVNTNKAYDLWYTGEWDAYVWDWCPDPDPDFMLSVFTTDQCLGWSDGCYSNPEYDRLYDLQQTQLDRTEREATIDQMQEMVAEELPTMVLNYWSDLQAFRTDTFDPSTYVPSPTGDLGLYLFGWSNDSYFNLKLVGQDDGSTTDGGDDGGAIPTWVWIAVGGGVPLAALVIFLTRRRTDEDEA